MKIHLNIFHLDPYQSNPSKILIVVGNTSQTNASLSMLERVPITLISCEGGVIKVMGKGIRGREGRVVSHEKTN